MLIPAGRSRFRFLIAVAGGLICTAALAIGLTIWWMRSDAIRDESKNNGNLAVVLAEQIANSIQSIDLVLTEIEGQIDFHGSPASDDLDRVLRGEETYQLLMKRLSRLQQAELIALVDKNGMVLNTT
jgi:hypothetical protein